MKRTLLAAAAATALAMATTTAQAQEKVFVGNLVDYTGATSSTGKFSGPGKEDAIRWINENGGINGTMIDFETIDYSYQAPRAIAQYKAWKQKGAVAIQGYGTADTEALIGFVTADRIPYYSLSLSAHLTDPQAKGPKQIGRAHV